jgi:ubiquinol-cytochrome c reductase iron-sulfur subunit
MRLKIILNSMIHALVGVFLVAGMSKAAADDFPAGYIQGQLIQAKRNITVNAARLASGELLIVEYVGRPIFVYRRTPSEIREIETADESALADPRGNRLYSSILSQYGASSSAVWARLLLLSQPIARNHPFRSIDKALTVVAGWSPESGCTLALVNPKVNAASGALFRDPCTGAQYDAAGRALAGMLSTLTGFREAWYNLAVPPYRIEQGDKIILGPLPDEYIPELNFSRDELYPDKNPTQLLIAAARYNDIETVRAALKAGAKANYYKPGEGSPIDAAVIGSSIEVIKLLVEHGAKKTPNTVNAALAVGRQQVLKTVP